MLSNFTFDVSVYHLQLSLHLSECKLNILFVELCMVCILFSIDESRDENHISFYDYTHDQKNFVYVLSNQAWNIIQNDTCYPQYWALIWSPLKRKNFYILMWYQWWYDVLRRYLRSCYKKKILDVDFLFEWNGTKRYKLQVTIFERENKKTVMVILLLLLCRKYVLLGENSMLCTLFWLGSCLNDFDLR